MCSCRVKDKDGGEAGRGRATGFKVVSKGKRKKVDGKAKRKEKRKNVEKCVKKKTKQNKTKASIGAS